MAQEKESPDTHMFSSVWVEINVDEDGTVTGIDDDESGDESESPDETTSKKKIRVRRCTRKRSPGLQNLLCDHCDYSTRHHACLQRHMIGKHTDPNQTVYKCSECSYESVFKSNLSAHRRKHTEKKFKCTHCDFSTAYRHCFLKHAKVHKNKEGSFYQCDKCPFVTKFEGHITRHLAKIHNEVSEKASKCENCNFTTKVGWRLNTHRNKSRRDNPIVCEYCEFTTVFMCEYKMHRASHRGAFRIPKIDKNVFTQNPDFTPNLISQDYTELDSQLDYDKSIHYTVDADSEVDWKNLPVTEIPGEERFFKCTVCDYSSKFKASIQRHHYRLHTDNRRPYKCIKCDFSTKTKDKIKLHAKRSQSDTLLDCTDCSFKTYFKCQLQQHHKQHNQFKCQFCEYTCRNHYDVQRHYALVHAKEGIKCQYCDFKAARRESVISHEASHTGIKPFRCNQCDYSCMRRRLLEAHVKKHHLVKNDEVVYIDDSKIEQLKEKLAEGEVNTSLLIP